ncbi:hypothetical protein FRC17_003346, partial [Serendipita sp. 399]
MAQLEALIQTMPANIFQTVTPGSDAPPASATSEVSSTSFPAIAPFPVVRAPPPGLSIPKVTNPGTHFVPPPASATDSVTAGFANVTLSPTYLYWDDEGFTRWQGAASCLPLLDSLVERSAPQAAGSNEIAPTTNGLSTARPEQRSVMSSAGVSQRYFPDRPLKRRVAINPETLWKTVTASIPPDLMDTLVQSYLSTTFYLMPFLHIPTFLHDYGNPTKWGEPGFVSFVTAVCCLASRHVDDKRVREDVNDPFSSGTHWFGLFNKLHALPSADRPTLYTVQAVLVAAVYAIGLGRLSKGFALLSESVTLSFDAGLHRSVEAYDCFEPIENEIRKRTFWAVYMWDKQVGAAFGRPPLIRLRDCDVAECSIVDDEAVNAQISPPDQNASPRIAAFVAAVRYFIVMESVLDAPPTLNPNTTSSFLSSASTTLVGFRRSLDMHEEESLLEEAYVSVPPYWFHNADGVQLAIGEDVIQTTQKHRLHCLEQWIRMLIHRQRLAVAITNGADEEAEVHEMMACHQAAVNIIHSQLQMATHGLMGFFGVGAIHQLNQAGRTLVAVLLNCRTSSSVVQQQLVEPGLEALRSCVVLLRRFSVRYLCGLRSADLIEEFCRISKIPLDAPPLSTNGSNPIRRAWLRPVRKKTASVAGSGTSPSDSGSPSTFANNNSESGVDTHNHAMSSIPASSLSTNMVHTGSHPTTTIDLTAATPGTFSGAAYDAYEALMNVTPSSSISQPTTMNTNNLSTSSLLDASFASAGSTYGQMDGADLIGATAPDDILGLLANTNYEAPFDLGMLYSTEGGINGTGGLNGLYGSSPMDFNALNAGVILKIIHSCNKLMSVPKYDVIIVGAGIAGPAMAYALSSSSNLRKSIPESSQRRRPLRILLMDSKLRKPDRIVGELLQPGGVNALRKIGLEHALEDIGAIRAKGYCVMRPKPHPSSSSLKDDGGSGTQFEQVHIPYPGGHEGRSFHHGEFVSSLRTCAASAPGVTLMERSVSSDLVCCPHTGRILGVRATRTQGGKEEVFLAKLTIFANGMSSFRKAVYQPFPSTSSASTSKPAADIHNNNMETKSLGSFHGLVLPHPPKKQYILPMYQHGTVILVPGAAGPILLYQISTHETRMLIDIPKNSPHAKAIPSYIKSVILPNLPTPELRQSLQTLVSEAEEKGEKLKTKSATNPFFPAPPQGGHRTREGGLLLGDAWNQRHPLTGGGMTVAFWDVVTLASELIAAERVLFGDDTQGN